MGGADFLGGGLGASKCCASFLINHLSYLVDFFFGGLSSPSLLVLPGLKGRDLLRRFRNLFDADGARLLRLRRSNLRARQEAAHRTTIEVSIAP